MPDAKKASRNLPPGTLRAPAGAASPEVIQGILYTPEGCHEGEFTSLAKALAWGKGKGVLWLNINGLGNLEFLQALNRELSFHPLALEDTLHTTQRPKVDVYQDHLYVVVRMFEFQRHLSREQLSIFLTDNTVVTVQERVGDCLEPVRNRLREGAGQIRSQPAEYLLYALLDAVVDSYFPLLEQIGEHIEALQERALLDAGKETLGHIHALRRDLLELRRAAWPLRDALDSLVRGDHSRIGAQTQLYLRDAYDHAIQVLDMTETYRELTGSLMDIYLSSLSNRMNEVMKVLTVISTIFIPLTFVAGIYGMNFRHMPELSWRFGYPAVWGVMVTTTVVMLVYFRRKGWLGGR